MGHLSLEDSDSDLSLFERWSTYCCLDCRIESTTLFLILAGLSFYMFVYVFELAF